MTRYVDPNSGSAPQPGGWAGAEGAATGHALPGFDTEVEQTRQLNEADEVAERKTVQEIVDAAGLGGGGDDDQGDNEASDDAAPDAGEEQDAVNAASVEHQGIDPSEAPEGADDKSEDAPEKEAPAKKADAKKAPAKKATSKK